MTLDVKQNWVEKLKTQWDLKNNIEFVCACLLMSLVYVGMIYFSGKILTYNGLGANTHLYWFWALRILIAIMACLLFYVILTRNKFLKDKWKLKSNFQLLIIYVLFSITGSASIRVAKPILAFIGVTDAMPGYIYWPLRTLVVFPSYQTLFMIFGTLLGQWKFAWRFEKKMLKGLGRLVGIKPSKEPADDE